MSDAWHSLIGRSGYLAGTAGTCTLPVGACVLQIVAHATAAGTISIFGGASIPVVAGTQFTLDMKDTLLSAAATGGGPNTMVFTGTDSYFVRWVREGHGI